MAYARAGSRHGAWTIRLDGKTRRFKSNGRGFPELDRLYRPKPECPHPNHWDDYTKELVGDAESRLLALFNKM
jgi:hypothetical protein